MGGRRGVILPHPTPKRTPKKPTQIRVKGLSVAKYCLRPESAFLIPSKIRIQSNFIRLYIDFQFLTLTILRVTFRFNKDGSDIKPTICVKLATYNSLFLKKNFRNFQKASFFLFVTSRRAQEKIRHKIDRNIFKILQQL